MTTEGSESGALADPTKVSDAGSDERTSGASGAVAHGDVISSDDDSIPIHPNTGKWKRAGRKENAKSVEQQKKTAIEKETTGQRADELVEKAESDILPHRKAIDGFQKNSCQKKYCYVLNDQDSTYMVGTCGHIICSYCLLGAVLGVQWIRRKLCPECRKRVMFSKMEAQIVSDLRVQIGELKLAVRLLQAENSELRETNRNQETKLLEIVREWEVIEDFKVSIVDFKDTQHVHIKEEPKAVKEEEGL